MNVAAPDPRATVWLVEDSPLEAEVASRALAATYDVEVFSDGAAMLERLAASVPPTALILDWRLPGLSGLEVCKFVRATWNQNALPVLMLTGLSDRADLVDAISAGANDYLTKPFDAAELSARVAAVVRTRALNDRLERAEARERDARREAQSANTAKDEFLAMTSHELRTPLNAILGWATLMRSGKLDSSGVMRAIETIERNARTQGKLIEDILDCSRIISNGMRIEKVPLNLGTVIQSAIEAAGPLLQKKGVTLSVALDPTPIQVVGDAERLTQVIWNLVSNAIKFTPSGGHVEVRLDRDGTTAKVSVKDNGEGIDLDFLPFVFERFRQAQGSTTRRHGGLGLGLAVVRHLVEAHGGEVKAFSEGPGKGALFLMTLPTSQGSQAAPEARVTRVTPVSETTLEGLSILVVDDEADSRDFLCAALRHRGAEVTSAESAEDALALLEAVNPDVLVSDIGMPRMDGTELVRAAHRAVAISASSARRIYALAVSAYARDEDEKVAKEAGFDEYLAKPVSADALVAKVAELAARRRAETR